MIRIPTNDSALWLCALASPNFIPPVLGRRGPFSKDTGRSCPPWQPGVATFRFLALFGILKFVVASKSLLAACCFASDNSI